MITDLQISRNFNKNGPSINKNLDQIQPKSKATHHNKEKSKSNAYFSIKESSS